MMFFCFHQNVYNYQFIISQRFIGHSQFIHIVLILICEYLFKLKEIWNKIFISVCLSVCLSVCMPDFAIFQLRFSKVFESVTLWVISLLSKTYVFGSMLVKMFVCLFVCLSVCLFVCLSVSALEVTVFIGSTRYFTYL